jgi:hypothetical protein
VVEETRDGLIIRGAKMLTTHGSTADEILVYPLPFSREICAGVSASRPTRRTFGSSVASRLTSAISRNGTTRWDRASRNPTR